jgi:hypothetical protein
MKQQQAGIIEAKAAIRRADESVIQGRSIVVFTVVTIFFVSIPGFFRDRRGRMLNPRIHSYPSRSSRLYSA